MSILSRFRRRRTGVVPSMPTPLPYVLGEGQLVTTSAVNHRVMDMAKFLEAMDLGGAQIVENMRRQSVPKGTDSSVPRLWLDLIDGAVEQDLAEMIDTERVRQLAVLIAPRVRELMGW